MNMQDFLSQHAQDCPTWLQAVTPEGPPPLRTFLNERTVFYPGCGLDGHAMKVFASARAAHCFVYADYGVQRDVVVAAIDSGRRGSSLRGYRPVARFDLSPQDFPVRWGPGVSRFAPREKPLTYANAVRPYAFLQVWERLPDVAPSWGADRLALLMLGADAHAVYEALFCQPGGATQLYGLLLQDHGFGGNYAPFGRDGLTARMAAHYQVFPEWQLVADANTRAWDGYARVADVEPSFGSGRHRFLYHRVQPDQRPVS